MVLAYDPISQTFDQDGWKAIQDVPILKEASSLWYYQQQSRTRTRTTEAVVPAVKDDDDEQDVRTTTGSIPAPTFTLEGPISCRELAVLYYQHRKMLDAAEALIGSSSSSNSRTCSTSSTSTNYVTEDTKVWSPSPTFQSSEWVRIAELPDLMTAMEAFEDCVDLCVNIDEKEEENNMVKIVEKVGDKYPAVDSSEKNANDDLLHDFFSSTDQRDDEQDHNNDHEDEMEEYQSDGGTTYVKHSSGGQWMKLGKGSKLNNNSSSSSKQGSDKSKWERINESNKRKQEQVSLVSSSGLQVQKSKNHKKPKFKTKNAKCWIYVTNLPLDTTEEEVAEFFKKAGVLDLNPETQKPRIKLYREKSSGDNVKEGDRRLKGDVSICYARPESVDLALQILDDAPFRTVDVNGKYIGNANKIKVQRAKFEQHGEEYKLDDIRKVSDKKRKVARLAKLQAVGWDDGENGRITGGLKGLRIIVLKNVFDAAALRRMGDETKEDLFLKDLETDLRKRCDEFGTVEKITIFYRGRIDGVVIVKFTQPTAAVDAIAALNGKELRGRTMEAVYWDGVTDYTVHDHDVEVKETEKRLDEFGHWLESQDLPEEFQLQVEDS
jgi:RNA recognition motif-containing protein